MLLTSFTLSTLALLLGKWLGRTNPARSSRLTAGMLFIILISPLLLLAPKLNINIPFLAQELSTSNNLTHSSSPSVFHLIWALITITLLIRIYIHHRATQTWLKQSTPHNSPLLETTLNNATKALGLSKKPQLKISKNIQSPIVTGLQKTTILLPESATTWPSKTLEMVILHELGHIRRRDLWSTLAAHITCAIHWFNPIVWILKKQLITQAEFACDAHIISKGTDAKSYIHALCDVASSVTNHRTPNSALAMAGQAPLKKRVETLLAGNIKNNTLITTAILTLTASTTLALTLVRPTSPELPKTQTQPNNYTPAEIQTRLTANPFPLD